jgi:hypothetical protein
MWDKENVLQQQALGLVGVNLIFGAFHYLKNQDQFIRSLVDNLTVDRIEFRVLLNETQALSQFGTHTRNIP